MKVWPRSGDAQSGHPQGVQCPGEERSEGSALPPTSGLGPEGRLCTAGGPDTAPGGPRAGTPLPRPCRGVRAAGGWMCIWASPRESSERTSQVKREWPLPGLLACGVWRLSGSAMATPVTSPVLALCSLCTYLHVSTCPSVRHLPVHPPVCHLSVDLSRLSSMYYLSFANRRSIDLSAICHVYLSVICHLSVF